MAEIIPVLFREEPEGGAWLTDQYGVAYWSPTGNPGYWSYGPVDPSQPHEAPEFIETGCADPEMHPDEPCQMAREIERQQRLMDNATMRGDLAAVAILSGRVRAYAPRLA
jgi:hypothetical protein